MAEEKTTNKTVRRPDYTSDGVAVWENIRENGHKYLSIKIVGHETIYVNQR